MSHSQSIKTRIHSLLVLACIAFAGMTTHGQAKANSGLFFADQHFNHLGHCWCKFDPDHRLPGDLRLGLQAQTGEIQLLKVSLGYYLTNNLYIKGAYHASKQDYVKYSPPLDNDFQS